MFVPKKSSLIIIERIKNKMNAKRHSKQSKKVKGYAPTKLKTGYPPKFKKKKKSPTHQQKSVMALSEQMPQRKTQTNFVIFSDMSLKNHHKKLHTRVKMTYEKKKKKSGIKTKQLKKLNSFVLQQQVISTLGSHPF